MARKLALQLPQVSIDVKDPLPEQIPQHLSNVLTFGVILKPRLQDVLHIVNIRRVEDHMTSRPHKPHRMRGSLPNLVREIIKRSVSVFHETGEGAYNGIRRRSNVLSVQRMVPPNDDQRVHNEEENRHRGSDGVLLGLPSSPIHPFFECCHLYLQPTTLNPEQECGLQQPLQVDKFSLAISGDSMRKHQLGVQCRGTPDLHQQKTEPSHKNT